MNNIQLLIERDGTQVTVAGLNTTTTWSSFITTVQNALNTGTSGWTVEVDGADQGTTTLASKTTFFRIKRPGDTDKSFLGDIAATASGLDEGAFIACYADSGLISLRRGAGAYYRVGDLTLKGNETGTSRKANFGVLMCSTQFIGHVIERIHAAYFESVFGILKGTGNNGEQIRFDRLYGSDCKKGFFCDAPQAFLQEFRGWYLGLDNDGVYLDLADADPPGYGIGLLDCHATFGDGGNPDGKGTLVRVRRGTGIVQWTGGRIEHMATLFDYDALDGQGPNESLDLIFRGVEFDATLNQAGADPSRPFVHGTGSTGSATQYGLVVDTCRFASSAATSDAAKTDLLLKATSPGLRCSFVRTRFESFRSIRTEGLEAEFDRCYRSDFSTPGATGNRFREFTEIAGTPGPRTQSLRTAWQDTPWIQTGPRTNILRNADFKGQAQSTGATSEVAFNTGNVWELTTDTYVSFATHLAGFGKWGKFAEANISPSPEAFYLGLKANTALTNSLSAIDLTATGVKVVTFQCLCRVKGRLRFSLAVPGPTGPAVATYDELVVGPGGTGETDVTLVTLRAQVAETLASGALALRVANNEATASSVQVLWQQAWGGREGDSTYPLAGALANAGFVRTPANQPVKNTYPWAVNALSVKAAGRFQLPLLDTASGGDAAGMGWQSPSTLDATGDFQDGDMYMDASLRSMMGRADTNWYQFVQPDRVLPNPDENLTWNGTRAKNLVYDGDTNRTLNLSTDQSLVPRGSVVRVFNVGSDDMTVTVKVGSSTVSILETFQMAEYLFYVDASNNARWLVIQTNLASARY